LPVFQFLKTNTLNIGIQCFQFMILLMYQHNHLLVD
jgi:hypothetical protein